MQGAVDHCIRLKAVNKSFWDKIYDWCCLDDFIIKSRLDRSPLVKEQVINEFAGYIANSLSRLFQIDKNGEAIGFVLLKNIDFKNRHCEFHIEIPEEKNQNFTYGYKILLQVIKFCFEQLNLNKIKTAVLSNNQTALGIMERLGKIGFQKDGILKQEIYFDGRYEDMHLFSLLRQNFKEG